MSQTAPEEVRMRTTTNTPSGSPALELLERARQACNPPTWYQLALQLNTSTQLIATWRKRNGAFDDDSAWGIAELLQLDPAHVIAIREEAREKNEWRKARWTARVKRMGGTLLVALAPWLHSPSQGDGCLPISQASSCSPYSRKRKTTRTPNSVPELPAITIMRRSLGRLGEWWRVRFARFPAALVGGS